MRFKLLSIFLFIALFHNVANCQKNKVNIMIKDLPIQISSILSTVFNPFTDESEHTRYSIANSECKETVLFPDDNCITQLHFSYNYYEVYLTPGDSLECNFKLDRNKKLVPVFSGKNSAHYNFHVQMYSDTSLIYPSFNKKKYVDNPQLLLTDDKNCYEKRKVYMDEYFKTNTTSTSFSKYVQGDLYFEYLMRLLALKSKGASPKELQVLSKAFNDTIFNRDDLVKSRNYTLVLLYKYLIKTFEGTIKADQDILSHYKDILSAGLSGLTKEYLLTNFHKYYSKRGFTSDYSTLDSITKVFNKEFHNNKLKDAVNNSFANFKLAFKPLPDGVLEDKLVSIYGKNIRFKELINQYKNKTIYIDFWASWCGPCIMDIQSKEAVEMRKLGKSKNVVFLNFSLDKTNEQLKWIKTLKSLPLDPKYQYRLVNDLNSPLAQYFKLNKIPHYVLIFKDGKSRIEDAPRITEKEKLKQYFN